jgi:phage major head subunit gpT-like protein
MAILTTRTSFQAATKVLEGAYTNRAQKVPPLYTKFFNIIKTDPKRDFASWLPIIEMSTLFQKPEGTAPIYDQPYEGIPYTTNFFTFALAAQITEEAQLEDPINLMSKVPAMLADSEQTTKDLIFWNVLNFGFNSNVIGSDGQPLFSTAHPLGAISVPGVGVFSSIGQTFSNSLGATQLTPDALQQMYILFETLLSDRGLPARRTPVYLMVGTQLAKTAEEILGTPYKPGTNQNDINVIKDTVKLVVNRYITSPTAWYVLSAPGDIEGDSHSLFVSHKWENRVATWNDPQTSSYNIKTSFRSAWGFITWRGTGASQGA